MKQRAAEVGITRQRLYQRIAKYGSLEAALARTKFKHKEQP